MNTEKKAWLFGKGQSLDKFDFKTSGSMRFALNELAFALPCYGAIAQDLNVLHKYIKMLNREIKVFTIEQEPKFYFYRMEKFEFDRKFADVATLATCILQHLGFTTIHYVGFDIIDGIGAVSKHVVRHGARWKEQPDELLSYLKTSLLTPIWEHRKCSK